MACVLVVEDEPLIAMALAMMLVDSGHTVCGPVNSVDAALREAGGSRPDVALVDVELRGPATGLDLVPKLTGAGVPCVIVSGHATRTQAEKIGAAGWVPKPYTRGTVLAAVARSLAPPTLHQSGAMPELVSGQLKAAQRPGAQKTRL